MLGLLSAITPFLWPKPEEPKEHEYDYDPVEEEDGGMVQERIDEINNIEITGMLADWTDIARMKQVDTPTEYPDLLYGMRNISCDFECKKAGQDDQVALVVSLLPHIWHKHFPTLSVHLVRKFFENIPPYDFSQLLTQEMLDSGFSGRILYQPHSAHLEIDDTKNVAVLTKTFTAFISHINTKTDAQLQVPFTQKVECSIESSKFVINNVHVSFQA